MTIADLPVCSSMHDKNVETTTIPNLPYAGLSVFKLSAPKLSAGLMPYLFVLALDATVYSQQPANSKVALYDSFDRSELRNEWTILEGEWKTSDGTLVGTVKRSENQAASIRHNIETGNAVFEFRFRFSEKTKSLEFGFETSNASAETENAMFSLRITPTSWALVEGKRDQPAENAQRAYFAKQKKNFEVNFWYTARITTWGPYVTAKIDNRSTLTGSIQTFAATKSAIVFRGTGGRIEIDSIYVWTQR